MHSGGTGDRAEQAQSGKSPHAWCARWTTGKNSACTEKADAGALQRCTTKACPKDVHELVTKALA